MDRLTKTLIPVKKVNAEQLDELLARMQFRNTSLLVRAGLSVLAGMGKRDFDAAIRAQADADAKMAERERREKAGA